ncbi:hypothetical protein UFOVP73_31 [uncultured Caudovirales phage]|uniref:Uncharacterized protein n=1 Tax=uncultured Caudovirales phage TaxID=2100421 RepID=A0A6J5KYP9_9CAUD|nr:hypothetical protein UFOVP73_31 [uncultured Caudovirales phage]CAB5195149.1 hypothetical protein UFOVP170_53 [uncultured Caudovirales phage]
MSRCMGGWCTLRERCEYYRPGLESGTLFERLCMPNSTECFQARRVFAWAR